MTVSYSKTDLANHNSDLDALQKLVLELPKLPFTIRYFDDFEDRLRSINNIEHAASFSLYFGGTRGLIKFNNVDNDIAKLMKHLLLYFISDNLAPSSIYQYLLFLCKVSRQELINFISSSPHEIKPLWALFLTKNDWSINTFYGLKGLLRFLAENHLNGWSPSYKEFISKTLPLPYVDKYAVIRSNDGFLSTEEEARIVHYFDSFAESINQNPSAIDLNDLNNAGLLLCSFQFGMRAVQIATLTLRSVRIWTEPEVSNQSVHLTFKTVKQRSKSTSRLLLRKIKYEWASIMVALYNQKVKEGGLGNSKLFSIQTVSEVSSAILKLASKITGKYTIVDPKNQTII